VAEFHQEVDSAATDPEPVFLQQKYGQDSTSEEEEVYEEESKQQDLERPRSNF
jgi:hypothetical protein